MQRSRDAIEFGGQVLGQDLAPRSFGFDRKVRWTSRQFGPAFCQWFGAARIVQQSADVIHEIVAGGAINAPVITHGFAAREDFFHDEIRAVLLQVLRPMFCEFFQPATQALAIFTRFGEAIDVIYPHAVDQPFGKQLENQRMRCLEYFGALDAHSTERADVEETPPIHFVGSSAPPGEAVMLALQQPMQTVTADGVIAGMRLYGGVDSSLALGRCCVLL